MSKLEDKYIFRDIVPEEGDQAADIEQICFPPGEACPPEAMRQRAAAASENFLVAVDRRTGRVAGFLNGLATDETVFRDAFFFDAGLHHPEGDCVMLLGLDVLPEHRGQGLARALMERYIRREAGRGRKRLILTCLKDKIGMYQRMGYTYIGVSQSVLGGEVWYDMEIRLNE